MTLAFSHSRAVRGSFGGVRGSQTVIVDPRQSSFSGSSLPRSGYTPQPRVAAQQRTLGSVPISHDTPKAFHKGIPAMPQSLAQLMFVFIEKPRQPKQHEGVNSW